jgi:predicted small lipoprotein YifL
MTHNLLWLRQISEPVLPRPFRPRALPVLIGAIALTLLLAGCGRKGGLDPPPGGYVLDPQLVRTPLSRQGAARPVEKPAYDADGRPIPPEGEKKNFPLDPLIK